MSVFYERFERHAHGDGLKGQSTHYCPGCGHGLAHKYLADAIEELGIQDRTIAVSPVGCSVFLYYYLDVGNTQAAHGRAPAVALGHKLANPESIVISYQGDGDLASIGLAEIVSVGAARHPDHRDLRQQRDLRDDGRADGADHADGPEDDHEPVRPHAVHGRAAEDGGADRGARRAGLRRARGALRREAAGEGGEGDPQGDPAPGRGQGLRLRRGARRVPDPPQADARRDREVGEGADGAASIPLGVKKDVAREEAWPLPLAAELRGPDTMLEVIGGSSEAAPRFCDGFPRTAWGDDIAVKLAGAGGDGAQTAAMLLARAAHQRGLRRHAHPELRPRVARRDLVRRRPHRPGRGALAGRAGAARAGGVQRAERREVRAPRAARAASWSTTARWWRRCRRCGRASRRWAFRSPRSPRGSARSS